MKKRLIVLSVAVLAMSTCMVGCKSNEQKEIEKELKEELGDEYDEELEELAAELAEEDAKEEAAVEEEPVEMKKYPLSSEWQSITVEDQAVQIDDVVLRRGIKVADAMDIISKSECNYTYEYNPEYLSSEGEWQTIEIIKDGVSWFEVNAFNYLTDTQPLKELIVIGYTSKPEAASYIGLAGKSAEEISALSLDAVKGLVSFYGDGYEVKENDKNDIIEVVMDTSNGDKKQIPNSEWTNYIIKFNDRVVFDVDKNLNACVGVHTFSSNITCEADPEYQEKLKENFTDEDYKNAGLIDDCAEVVVDDQGFFYGVTAAEYEGTYGITKKGTSREGMTFLFKCDNTKGKDIYATARVQDLVINPDGSVSHGTIYTQGFESYDDAKKAFE